jgi:hypothetical protein
VEPVMRMVLSLKHLATLLVASMAAADLKCTNLKKGYQILSILECRMHMSSCLFLVYNSKKYSIYIGKRGAQES